MEYTNQALQEMGVRLERAEERIGSLEALLKAPNRVKPSSPKGVSLREFLGQKLPVDDVERTLAIGYYLEHQKGLTAFNIEDLRREFMGAKAKPPVNINDKINMNIRKGCIMEAPEKKDNKKAWIVTDTGEQQVEQGFKNA